jgi:hypothetical protein
VGRPKEEEYWPGLQGLQATAPATLNCPTPQATAVEDTLPAGHTNPGEHGPIQEELVWPARELYRPPGHTSVQLMDARPAVAPYLPAGQLVHGTPPPGLNCPGAHSSPVAFTLPAGHWEPGPRAQGEQGVAPPGEKNPTGHTAPVALGLKVGQPEPGGAVQGLQAADPATANVPGSHGVP